MNRLVKFGIALIPGLFGISVIAQTVKFPDYARMAGVVSLSMQSVCKVDRNSRQCELFQVLATEQGNSSQVLPGFFDADTRSDFNKNVSYRKKTLSAAANEDKISLSKMYSSLKNAQESICQIGNSSKACDTALTVLYIQTEVEVGEKPNPPALLSVDAKNKIRQFIRKKHPQLDESSSMVVEAAMTKEMLSGNK